MCTRRNSTHTQRERERERERERDRHRHRHRHTHQHTTHTYVYIDYLTNNEAWVLAGKALEGGLELVLLAVALHLN